MLKTNRTDDSPIGQSEIVRALRSDIIFGRLRPRERLVENELLERFSVARHQIRNALHELDRLGLVECRPNRGAIVVSLSPEDVDALYDFRSILQREAALRIALPASPQLIKRLKSANADYRRHLEKGALDLVAESNDLFHRTLFESCGNRYLAEAIEHYWLLTATIHSYAIGRPGSAVRSHKEHEDMIEALAAGDRDRLAKLCVSHMYPALEHYKAAHGGWPVDVKATSKSRASRS